MACGVAAYVCWGFFPLYWPLLEPATPLEVLAHRVVWSMVFVLVLITALRKWPAMLAIARNGPLMVALAAASVMMAANWGVFIYGVTNEHVIETSLGYFINPLVTVLLAVFVLHESLRPAQWAAVGVGAIAVVVLTLDYGRLPWIALAVALTFAAYGFLKKRADLGAAVGLGMETAILFPIAVAYLAFLAATGTLTFGHHGGANVALLIGTGLVTAIPLLLFSGAATGMSLTTLGVLQYLGPIIQFIAGLTIFGEDMPATRWIGFALVWCALVMFTLDALRSHRRAAQPQQPC